MKTPSFLALFLMLQCASAQNAPVPPRPAPPPPVALPAPPPPPSEDDVVIEQRIPDQPPRRVRASQGGVEALTASGAALTIRDFNGSTKPSRCLVVLFNATDPETLSRAEEDLAIMARILDKAARTRREEERFVMGINVDGSVFGSSSGARNIYVEGQGALFLLSVKYPLIAPPEKSPEPKAKDPSSDEWKKAREEVTGGGGGDSAQFFEYPIPGAGGPAEDFDEDKVNDLKDALIGALKNATHLRMVKPDEFITVVVQGADAIPTTVSKTTGKAGVRVNVTTRAGAGGNTRRSESVLTLRVKKSDADAYASGKMDLDTFRKKVSTQSYLRRPFASAVPDMFNLPTVRQ